MKNNAHLVTHRNNFRGCNSVSRESAVLRMPFKPRTGKLALRPYENFSYAPNHGLPKEKVNVNLREQKGTRVERGISCKKQKPPSSYRRYSLSRERRFVVVKSCIKHWSHEVAGLRCIDASASPYDGERTHF
jgi:hypothetical protein